MSDAQLPTRFDPRIIEARWQEEWRLREYFRAPSKPAGPSFAMVLPPPNVTGSLTVGHILGDTVMDLMARRHRMMGRPTLWLPGVDHAGLATQVEVRRRLAKQGIRMEELPREEVLHHLEQWRREFEARIRQQSEAAGLSLDWSRYRYTMDPGASRATREAFVRLYRAGLVYRGERIVNWDPKLQTAISDLEVKHTEEPADLLYVTYRWADGSEGGIVVATVRPETIFGDVAVAVHPEDARHQAAVGRSVRLPLTNRVVPVIADPKVDPTFGNGALKVTPGHDMLDFEIYRGHTGLGPPAIILDSAGRLTSDSVPEDLRGADRDEARRSVTEQLQAHGHLVRTERIVHSVGRSDRSDAIIEPRLSTQWFVRMGPLASPVIDAVRSGEIRLHPDRWSLTFFRWMESLQDWCISRQILWGHSIPVHYCTACRAEFASVDVPTRCERCGSTDLRSDPDVLDTWFTSWLWPFATLGWPEETEELAGYYPTSVLVTGRDIMFFWVARMMMAGYYFRDARPFSDVYFTGMLRDERGVRMSKHLGNSPDPLDLIRTHGADTVRFGLLFPNPVDQDANFGPAPLQSARNFLTKLWNLGRFTLGQLTPVTSPPHAVPSLTASSSLENRWILSRWSRTREEVDEALSAFDFTRAASTLHAFVWHDLADRYVEIAKDALQGRQGESRQRESRAVLLFVYERSLRLLHPMIPHVTEELWHALPHEGDSLTVAAWPTTSESRADPEAEVAMEVLWDSLTVLRNLRAENRVPVDTIPSAWIRPSGPIESRLFQDHREAILRMARVQSFEILEASSPAPLTTASSVTPRGEFFLQLPASIGGAETESLEREREKLLALLRKTQERLDDKGFRTKAPPNVVEAMEAKARDLENRLQRIGVHLERGERSKGSR